ncbi:MAG: type I-C CRISPR-associated protein Cas8c/Csd1 [Oscillospiraceae bacterium]|nr:type I-C CRISPR-associated protein Cas8c/Csd1 [Oscillospiraceae bacterium]
MSIWQKAYDTFENNTQLIGKIEEGKQPLVPVGHILKKVDVEISIDLSGHFRSAKKLDSSDCRTIIPATEESAGRTGEANDRPHPLCDKLKYLSPSGGSAYSSYLKQLRGWEESEFTSPKLTAILKYVEGGSIVSDLINEGVISPTKEENPFVRWRIKGENEEACWKDKELFEKFQAYQDSLSSDKPKALCMISGKQDILTHNYPKGVVSSSFNSKLISTNDTTNFTYRGRFVDNDQAITIGYTASQKVHNALSWLCYNQGDIQGNRTFVCWNPEGKKVMRPTMPFVTGTKAVTKAVTKPSDYKKALTDTLNGYRNELPKDKDVVIVAFDAPSDGRLSIAYYSEIRASDFYDRLEHWYDTCCMPNGNFGIQSPLLYNIVACTFGTQRDAVAKDGKDTSKIEVPNKVLGEQIQRLIVCMTERKPIPSDIVRILCKNASQPLRYSAENRSKVLYTACAVLRKYLNDKLKEEKWTMELDTSNHDRSYLFGRLLAVMEYVERETYDWDEKREPNAINLFSTYCMRPYDTASILEKRLVPYMQKHKPKKREELRRLEGEIFAVLNEKDAADLNRPLENDYLLGYYLQRNAFYSTNNELKTIESEENKNGNP